MIDASAGGAHRRDGVLRSEKRSLLVHRGHKVEILLCEFLQRFGDHNPRIVDHDVETTEGFDRGRDEPLHVVFAGHVRGNIDRLPTGGAYRMKGRFALAVGPAIVDHDLCPFVGERNCDRPADARAGPGHDRYFSPQSSHLLPPALSWLSAYRP